MNDVIRASFSYLKKVNFKSMLHSFRESKLLTTKISKKNNKKRVALILFDDFVFFLIFAFFIIFFVFSRYNWTTYLRFLTIFFCHFSKYHVRYQWGVTFRCYLIWSHCNDFTLRFICWFFEIILNVCFIVCLNLIIILYMRSTALMWIN